MNKNKVNNFAGLDKLSCTRVFAFLISCLQTDSMTGWPTMYRSTHLSAFVPTYVTTFILNSP